VGVGDMATWFAVGIAIIVGFIALGNANSAKRQAAAAEGQVAVMRQQLAAQQEDRYDRDAPVFQLATDGHVGQKCDVVVTVEDAPGRTEVAVVSITVRPAKPPTSGGETPSTLPIEQKTHTVTPGGHFVIPVDLRADKEPMKVEVELTFTELDGRGRTWQRHRTIAVHRGAEFHFPQ
jgi:hypothetical protein